MLFGFNAFSLPLLINGPALSVIANPQKNTLQSTWTQCFYLRCHTNWLNVAIKLNSQSSGNWYSFLPYINKNYQWVASKVTVSAFPCSR